MSVKSSRSKKKWSVLPAQVGAFPQTCCRIVSDQVQAGIVAQQLEKALQEQHASAVLSSAYLQEGNWTDSWNYFKTQQDIFSMTEVYQAMGYYP